MAFDGDLLLTDDSETLLTLDLQGAFRTGNLKAVCRDLSFVTTWP